MNKRVDSHGLWYYDPVYQAAQTQLIEQRIFNAKSGKPKEHGTGKYIAIMDIIREGYDK